MKKPTPEPTWRISKIRKRAEYLGTVTAPDEASAIIKACEKFGIAEDDRLRIIALKAEY